jgi:hypothetical protein
MASLKDSIEADRSGYERVDTSVGIGGKAGFPPPIVGQPTINPFLRCPMPPVAVTPDSLRQYYSGGQIPQFRVLTPSDSSFGAGRGGGTVIIKSVSSTVSTTSSGSGSPGTGGGSGSTGLSALSVSLTTPILSNGNTFFGTIPISKSFQLLSISANNPCRVEIYGTALAQNLDVARALDIAPLPGTQQNLITDVVLDTLPYQWTWQNRVGANGDSPQQPLAYVTVTNIAVSSVPITITILYVPLESI